ncbi:MAG: hypothetical protein PF692_10430 [Kiritimatiellae bacterium]|jgi:hypothetical protein|nr:hypothetical protein [Kiritimatiellia bacterium]
MLQALEATIEASGEIHLLEPIHLAHSCRAIVTIIEEPEIPETALLCQQSLAHDWESPEEDEAWSHLQ